MAEQAAVDRSIVGDLDKILAAWDGRDVPPPEI
jgi:hypothetical protein